MPTYTTDKSGVSEQFSCAEAFNRLLNLLSWSELPIALELIDRFDRLLSVARLPRDLVRSREVLADDPVNLVGVEVRPERVPGVLVKDDGAIADYFRNVGVCRVADEDAMVPAVLHPAT